jgi:protein-S-isoprenylcysteine O-methyltransferase Ste14
MANIEAESVADFIPESAADLLRNQHAVIAALAICGVFGDILLLVPSFSDWHSANCFLAWRGTLLVTVNSGIAMVGFRSWGQDTEDHAKARRNQGTRSAV